MRNNKFYYYLILIILNGSIIYSQSLQELQKLKAEYEKLKKNQSQLKLEIPQDRGLNTSSDIPSNALITPYREKIGIDSYIALCLHGGAGAYSILNMY